MKTQDKVFCTINTDRICSSLPEIAGAQAGKVLPLDTAVQALQALAVEYPFEGLLETRTDYRMILSGYIPQELLQPFVEGINRQLKQDCCAVEMYLATETFVGLIGENTAPYGGFNYDYFLHRGATDCPRTTFKLGGAYAD